METVAHCALDDGRGLEERLGQAMDGLNARQRASRMAAQSHQICCHRTLMIYLIV